jgi:hypothetical protein
MTQKMDIWAMRNYFEGFTLRNCSNKTMEMRVSTVEKRQI